MNARLASPARDRACPFLAGFLACAMTLPMGEGRSRTDRQAGDPGTGSARVRSLDFSLGNVPSGELARLAGSTDLRGLDLLGARIGDEDLKNLAGLTNLKALYLESTAVGDAGLVHLRRLTGLRTLALTGTRVTDAGLCHLKGLTGLQALDLSFTEVTRAGVEGLRHALPGAEIVKDGGETAEDASSRPANVGERAVRDADPVSSSGSQDLPGVGPARVPFGIDSPKQARDSPTLPCSETTGLHLLRPYRRGRIPVVFVHGLWSSPTSWSYMIDVLGSEAGLLDRYQFWTFGYSTGNPILYSASLLRRDLEAARRTFDPGGSDAAFDRMVVVGHSMGGLLAKMMVQDSGPRLWQLASNRPVDELAGDPEDLDLLRRTHFFKPRAEVHRMIFIATPHRGSRINRAWLKHLNSRLVPLQEPLRVSYGRLLARNGPAFFKDRLREGRPTSLDDLEWDSPMLACLGQLGLPTTVEAHSIIADRREPPGPGGGDGLVSYESAHLNGLRSELIVSAGHFCQDDPAVIREVRRILVEGGGTPMEGHPSASGGLSPEAGRIHPRSAVTLGRAASSMKCDGREEK